MQKSYNNGRIWGLYLLVVGGSLMSNTVMEMGRSATLFFMGGCIIALIGAIILDRNWNK